MPRAAGMKVGRNIQDVAWPAIIFPIECLVPSRLGGGIAESVYVMARELARAGLPVQVLTRMRGVLDPSIIPDVCTTRLGVPTIYVSGARPGRYLARIARFLLREARHPAIVHLHGCFALESQLSAMVCLAAGLPFVLSPEGEMEAAALAIKRTKKILALPYLRLLYRRAAAVLATCETERQSFIATMGPHPRIEVVPHGIGIESRAPADVDLELAVGVRGPYILYLGRISRIKALENLVAAVARIPPENTLVIAGDVEEDPDYTRQLRELIRSLALQSRVRFVGHAAGALKSTLFEQACLTVLPSRSENFGLVVVESLLSSTPVLAATGTPWRELQERQCGYWVPNDPETLAGVIREHIRLPREQRDQMGRRGRQLVEEKYLIHRVIHRYIDVYRSLLRP